MDTTIQIKLDAELAESLKRASAQQGISVEEAIQDLARKYVREARDKIINQEFDHYLAMHADLKAKYLGQHVAIHEGQLVDHDDDPMLLVRRVRGRFGQTPVLITQVEEKPIPEFIIRSPRLVRSE
jgi:hypothetical protein